MTRYKTSASLRISPGDVQRHEDIRDELKG